MFGKDRRLKTIGVYPNMSLKTARREAQTFLATQDPSLTRNRFMEARDAFLADCETRLRQSTITQYRLFLFKYEFRWLSDIQRTSIDTTYPHEVASWKAFMNWCVRNELTDKNPFIMVRAKTNVRDRVLSDDEVRAIWSYEFPPFSDIVKLLLLTGLRRMEVMHLQLVGDDFYLPPEHSKNHKGHTFPASEWSRQFVLPRFNGWSKAKARMDKHIPIPHWTLHDIRRTYATIHARIGTPLHVIEALLNHKSGEISGIKAVYIRHNFMEEARSAIAKYEEMLHSIVS